MASRLPSTTTAIARPRLLPLPRCAKCQKLVERMTEERQDFVGHVKFRVHCHGRTETVRLDDDQLRGNIAMGVAFGGNRG